MQTTTGMMQREPMHQARGISNCYRSLHIMYQKHSKFNAY